MGFSYAKSALYSSGIAANYQHELANLMGIKSGCLPVRYLGFLLHAGKLTITDCMPLIEKMVSRIKAWTSRFLSFAGRLLLIKSVLSCMYD